MDIVLGYTILFLLLKIFFNREKDVNVKPQPLPLHFLKQKIPPSSPDRAPNNFSSPSSTCRQLLGVDHQILIGAAKTNHGETEK